MTLYFEWIGSICGVLGALMISTNTRVSPWGGGYSSCRA